jgi:hypothetical protein
MATTAIVPIKTGRPSNYRDEYPEMLVQYFQRCFDTITASPIEPQDDEGRGSSKRAVQRMYQEFPTIAGFAHMIGTHEQRLYEWSLRHEALAEARARCVGLTKHLLVTGMLDGRWNAQAAQFVGKNLAGMKDKIEVETTAVGADSDDTAKLKQLLANASPAHLAEFSRLVEQMQAAAPAVEPATEA